VKQQIHSCGPPCMTKRLETCIHARCFSKQQGTRMMNDDDAASSCWTSRFNILFVILSSCPTRQTSPNHSVYIACFDSERKRNSRSSLLISSSRVYLLHKDGDHRLFHHVQTILFHFSNCKRSACNREFKERKITILNRCSSFSNNPDPR
jgi:hypothetical protein